MLLCNDMIKWYVEAAENLFTIFINILSPYKITHMWWLSNDVVKWYVEAAETFLPYSSSYFHTRSLKCMEHVHCSQEVKSLTYF